MYVASVPLVKFGLSEEPIFIGLTICRYLLSFLPIYQNRMLCKDFTKFRQNIYNFVFVNKASWYMFYRKLYKKIFSSVYDGTKYTS